MTSFWTAKTTAPRLIVEGSGDFFENDRKAE